ncbi:primary-amine oxidase [Micromonospora sp. NPDC049523]|uniref:copper amine oxidase n=1 Tax=Micromonospora sp. NPDC049523 TaxID=3155921 RepID=UPI00343019D0
MRNRKLTALLGAATTVTLLGALAAAAPATAADERWTYCDADAMVKQELPNGSLWQLCWRMDDRTGLVLERVAYQGKRDANPITVLNQVTIAQLNVPYDSGANEWNDITSYGFGGRYLQQMSAVDCKGGSRRGVWTEDGQSETKVMCVKVEDTGLAYRLQGETPEQPIAKQGQDVVLRTIAKVGWYEYITEYRLQDDGAIAVRLGATGDLAPRDYTTVDDGWPLGAGQTDFATNHYHSAFWKVDFNIGGRGQEKVEQYDTAPTGENGTRAAIYHTTKTAVATEAPLNTALRRWWRVVSPTSKNSDGHNRSYELELGASDAYEAHPETQPDVTFTQYKPCEKFATFNLDPECAGRGILDYSDGESLTDPVMWVRVGYHHVPRDEDQSPMPVHWQGFDLLPRDYTATNPIGPASRLDVNGRP